MGAARNAIMEAESKESLCELYLAQLDKQLKIEHLLEECKEHTLFKLAPVSSLVSRIREILES